MYASAALVLALALTLFVGRVAFARRIAREVDRMFAAAKGDPRVVSEDDLVGVPQPVQRWLRASNVVGSACPVTVRLTQQGEFRMGEGRGWMPFSAEEYYTTDPPSYVWRVRFKMAPLLAVSGRDSYAEGRASIQMWMLSVIPAAILSPYITWEGRDDHSAVATMSYAGTTASATFIFDDLGRLRDMTAERFDNAKKAILPWSTPITDYAELAGINVPVQGAGVWHYDTGQFPYIRLRVTGIEYNAPSASRREGTGS